MAAKKKPATKAETHRSSNFSEIFDALRDVLRPRAKGLVIKVDAPGNYYVESPKPYEGKPLFVAAVRAGKAYVSYYLFPIYMNPELVKTIPPELKKRLQGKSCFNFKTMEPEVFEQLAELTDRGLAEFKKRGLI